MRYAIAIVLLVAGCGGVSGPFGYQEGDALQCSEGFQWMETDEAITVTCKGEAVWTGPPSSAETAIARAALEAALARLPMP